MLPQLKWNNFTGVHAIVLKGCTSPNPSTYEATLSLLSQFTPLLDVALMDPTMGSAFAVNVMALLPYMVANYEDATPLCIRSAENIAHVSYLRLFVPPLLLILFKREWFLFFNTTCYSNR